MYACVLVRVLLTLRVMRVLHIISNKPVMSCLPLFQCSSEGVSVCGGGGGGEVVVYCIQINICKKNMHAC